MNTPPPFFFLGLVYSLSKLCPGEEKKIPIEIMHFHYRTDMATPYQKNPCPGGHEFNIWVDHSFVIININLVCSIYARE